MIKINCIAKVFPNIKFWINITRHAALLVANTSRCNSIIWPNLPIQRNRRYFWTNALGRYERTPVETGKFVKIRYFVLGLQHSWSFAHICYNTIFFCATNFKRIKLTLKIKRKYKIHFWSFVQDEIFLILLLV